MSGLIVIRILPFCTLLLASAIVAAIRAQPR
jgi:hypothetical protein